MRLRLRFETNYGSTTNPERFPVSLVNIPIKVFPATSSSMIPFNQLHAVCQTRIQQKRRCPHQTAKCLCLRRQGYEFEKGYYVILEEEDFEKVRPPPASSIGAVWGSRPLTDTSIGPTTWRPMAHGGRCVCGHARRQRGEGRSRARALRLRYSCRAPRRRGIAMHTPTTSKRKID